MRYYQGPTSDHFNGHVFSNTEGKEPKITKVLQWLFTRTPSPSPKKQIVPTVIPTERLPKEQTKITFVNHSTLLIQWEGLNILTDPLWAERASPFSWIGPQRAQNPGISLEDLPPIDLILISHNHYDHMDIQTLLALHKKFHPRIISGLGNGKYLAKQGIQDVQELDWWNCVVLPGGVEITYVPAIHFSARWPWNRNQMLWGGFCLKNHSSLIYFAGDTAYGSHFKLIKERIGSPSLACLPIGAFEPRWFMSANHISPEEAVQAFQDLNANEGIAIHFGTFQMADEGINEPVERLKIALKERHVHEKNFWIPNVGESKTILQS